MGKVIHSPKYGKMIDLPELSTITGLSWNTLYHQEFRGKGLIWQSYVDPNKPNKTWYRASDVLAWIEDLGGYGGQNRIPITDENYSPELIERTKEEK